jgi:hypothetical protein
MITLIAAELPRGSLREHEMLIGRAAFYFLQHNNFSPPFYQITIEFYTANFGRDAFLSGVFLLIQFYNFHMRAVGLVRFRFMRAI